MNLQNLIKRVSEWLGSGNNVADSVTDSGAAEFPSDSSSTGIIRCPACGQILSGMESHCPDCGIFLGGVSDITNYHDWNVRVFLKK